MRYSKAFVTVALIICIGNIGIIGKNFAKAMDDESDLHKYNSIKQLARAVGVMKFDDNNINWNHFRHIDLYENATAKVQHCIKDQAELGNSLSDYEVMDCVYETYHLHETTHHS